MSALPDWLQYAQAVATIATPVTVMLITAVGAWIAFQQMRIARMKLHHDRYEKRLKVFEAARTSLSEAVVIDKISNDTLKKFATDTVDAPFHFSEDLVDYLEKLKMTAGSMILNQQAAQELVNTDHRSEAQQRAKSQLDWLQDEFQSGRLLNWFLPYLALDPRRIKR